MKKLLSTLILGLMVTSASANIASFSAFSDGQNLYVTVLGDTCNQYRGSLKVPAICKDDRLTRNGVASCDVELNVSQTKIACLDGETIPRTMVINLADENFAREASRIILKRNSQKVQVQLKSEEESLINVEAKTTTAEETETYPVACSRSNSSSCSK